MTSQNNYPPETSPLHQDSEISTLPLETTKRRYGVLPERLDPSSLTYKIFAKQRDLFPSYHDMRPKCPPIYDQLSLGSCTANALIALYQYDHPSFMGSRLFLYYNEREKDGTIDKDAGSTLSQGIRCMQNSGVCAEELWPYHIDKFRTKPPQNCYENALKYKAIKCLNVKQNAQDIKLALMNNQPICLAIKIYKSFESDSTAKTGIVNMPGQNDPFLGGHAIVCVGFDDNKKVWIMRNSWGIHWGDKGYFYLPYAYLTDHYLASDFWILDASTQDPQPQPAPQPQPFPFPKPLPRPNIKPFPFPDIKPFIFPSKVGNRKLMINSPGNIESKISDYGNELQKNKCILNQAFTKARVDYNLQAIILAMGMLESNYLHSDHRDTSKDGSGDGSQNVSLFNLNIDMIRYLGYNESIDYYNDTNNLDKILEILVHAFYKWGIDSTLNYVRGGRTAFQDGYSYGAEEYRNVIASMAKIIENEPSLRYDSRRVEIYLKHV